jgi:hypothetical protein
MFPPKEKEKKNSQYSDLVGASHKAVQLDKDLPDNLAFGKI